MMRKHCVLLMKAMLSAALCSVGILSSTAYASDSDPTPVKPGVMDVDGVKWVLVYTPEELMYIDSHQEERNETGHLYVESNIAIMNDIDMGVYKKTGWIPLGGSSWYRADVIETDWSGTLKYQGNSIKGLHWDDYADYGSVIGDVKSSNLGGGMLDFAAALLQGGFGGRSWYPDVRHRVEGFSRPAVVRRDGETWVQIRTPEELLYLDYNQSMPIEAGSQAKYLDANIELMNDIDLSAHSNLSWMPLGGAYSIFVFKGTFNGRGHVIKGWEINNSTDPMTGFFGIVTGKIVNLDLDGAVNSTSGLFAGGMAALLPKGGVILNSSFHGTVKNRVGYIGGLVGYANGTILNSYVTGNIITEKSLAFIGGLAGVSGGTISDSYFAGDIEGLQAGGLVGYKEDGIIADSYATGTIKDYGPGATIGNIIANTPLVSHERAVAVFEDGKAENIYRYYFLKDNINSAYNAGWDNDNVWRPYFNVIGYPWLLQLDSMSWSSLPSDSQSGGTIAIGGTVYNAEGKPAPAGVKVDLSNTVGNWAGSPGASVRLTTDNEGRFTAQWTAPEVVQDTSVQFKATLKIANQDLGNSALTTSITKSLTIKPLSPLTLDPKSDSPIVIDGTVGQSVSRTFAATGGRVPYKWQMTSGMLPAGVTFSESGKLSGTPAASGTYAFTATVTDDTTRNTVSQPYTLVIKPVLTNLSLSEGVNLSPAFAASTEEYTATVDASAARIEVTPTAVASDAGATIEVEGSAVTSGGSRSIDLQPGENTIPVRVTSKDGSLFTTYTIVVTREKVNLSGLTLTSGTLSPKFDPDTTEYTANVVNEADSISVTPTALDGKATLKVNGIAVASGKASQKMDLKTGQNTIRITITNQDGTLTNAYTLIVTRETAGKPNEEAGKPNEEVGKPNLSGLTLSSGTLSPKFDSGTTSYTASVANEVDSIAVTPTALDGTASVTVNGISVAGGKASIPIALNPGGNTINIVITALNGETKTYTLTVTRAKPEAQPADVLFKDILGHWAEKGIMQASGKGFVNGYADGTFKPDKSITRAEFVVMMMKVMSPPTEEQKLQFKDSDKIGAWATKAVSQAAQAGIVNGYEDGSFHPDALITRAEMAVMVSKALKLTLVANAPTGFADDKAIPSWAKGAIAAVREQGLMKGSSMNQFNPSTYATRAEGITVLLNLKADK